MPKFSFMADQVSEKLRIYIVIPYVGQVQLKWRIRTSRSLVSLQVNVDHQNTTQPPLLLSVLLIGNTKYQMTGFLLSCFCKKKKKNQSNQSSKVTLRLHLINFVSSGNFDLILRKLIRSTDTLSCGPMVTNFQKASSMPTRRSQVTEVSEGR